MHVWPCSDRLIFAWLLIWRKNPTYVTPFGSHMKCNKGFFKIPSFSSSSVFLSSKVAPWHVDCWYELHLWSFLAKFGLKSQKLKNVIFHVFCNIVIFEFLTPEGGLRTIRKTELEENNEILKNHLYTLHKGPKRHNICRILLKGVTQNFFILFFDNN